MVGLEDGVGGAGPLMKESMLGYYESHPEYYSTLSKLYDDAIEGSQEVTDIAAIIGESGFSRVLDVGCGSGSLLINISKTLKSKGKTADLHGIDVSSHAIRLAREHSEAMGLKLTLTQVDAEGAPGYGAGFFDMVVSTHALEHMVNPAQMLSNMDTLLKSGGCLYLTFPGLFKCFSPPWERNSIPLSLRAAKVFDSLMMLLDPVYLRFRFTKPCLEGVCEDTDMVFLSFTPEIVRFLEKRGYAVKEYHIGGRIVAYKGGRKSKDRLRTARYLAQTIGFSAQLLVSGIKKTLGAGRRTA